MIHLLYILYTICPFLTLYFVCYSSPLRVDGWHSDKSCGAVSLYINSCIFCTYPGVEFPVPVAARRRTSAAARLLRLWVRIPPEAWIFFCCESCVLSGRGLCDELITRPEESYRMWCVVVCDLETSFMRRP